MARQRFIWPTIWADKTFGELKPDEQVLFMALVSLADDEGRLNADPMFLRAQVFGYKDYSAKKVENLRNGLVERMRNVHLYRPHGYEHDVIQLLKWAEYQRPKYAKPSKIPPPLAEDSPNVPPILEEDFPIGQGRVGMDRDGQGKQSSEDDVGGNLEREVNLLHAEIGIEDKRTKPMLERFASTLPAAAFATAREDLTEQRAKQRIDNPGGYVKSILERMVAEGQYRQAAA